jgi:hypothetical protein
MRSRVSPDAFLADFPEPMQAIADEFRRIVRRTVPEAIEAVRPGWHLIGYDVPNGKRTAYFAYVAPEPAHVHLGFEHGVLMADPERRLEGAGVTRQVRWLTFRGLEDIDEAAIAPLIHEAVRVARMGRAGRIASALDRDDGWSA